MPNVCPCPNPPGGSVVCDDDQIAVCRVTGGRIESGCLSPARAVAAVAASALARGAPFRISLFDWLERLAGFEIAQLSAVGETGETLLRYSGAALRGETRRARSRRVVAALAEAPKLRTIVIEAAAAPGRKGVADRLVVKFPEAALAYFEGEEIAGAGVSTE